MQTILEKRNPNYSSRKGTKKNLGYMNEDVVMRRIGQKIKISCPWCGDYQQSQKITNNLNSWLITYFYCSKSLFIDINGKVHKIDISLL